ncbi:MAG: DEAD/DEAH box helicase, partial [Owenweeksia sp.]
MNTIHKRPANKKAGVKRNNNNSNKSPRNRKKQSSIDVSLLTRQALPQAPVEPYTATRTFADLPIHHSLKSTIARKGFTRPTEIQDKTMDHLLAGRDLLGIAQTGTGKTAAFLVPLINRLLEGQGNFQTLVLVPTRELAIQVEEEFKSLTAGLKLYSSCFIGGTNINRDLQTLRRKSHLVVGTPGRLMDLYQRRALRFSDFSVLILDEFDRMLDMGFNKDVMRIAEAIPKRKQTLLFSATLDKQQQVFIDRLLRNPAEVKVSSGETTNDHIDQEIIKVPEGEDKFQILLEMLARPDFEKVLIFAETKRWVSRVSKKLGKSGIQSDEIHGNKSQNYRQSALERFKTGKVQVLVATDVAARGLDVTDVTHVINYQLPSSLDSYIHRIGRT